MSYKRISIITLVIVSFLMNAYPISSASLSLTHPGKSEDSILPIIVDPYTQEYPRVSNRRIVFHDGRYANPTDIYLINLDDGTIVNVTNTPTWELNPDIDGDVVVWKDGYDGLGIHGKILSTDEFFTVTEGQADVSRPRIAENIVVWAENDGEKWKIQGYDITKGVKFLISDLSENQYDPNIDGNTVVWHDNTHVYAYNLDTEVKKIIPTPSFGVRSPDISGNTVVWLDSREGNWDIYSFDLLSELERPLVVGPGDKQDPVIDGNLVAWWDESLGTPDIHLHLINENITFPVLQHSGRQQYPAIGENIIAWQDNRNHNWDIFIYSWEGIVPIIDEFPLDQPTGLQVGAFPGGEIQMKWIDNSVEESGYKIERSSGFEAPVWQEIATLTTNTTSFADYPPRLNESYWYRVRAFNNNGFSAYSNESYNSTFANVPNLDEMYLHVLINEARSDPAEAGFPEYSPLPPVVYNPLLAYATHSHSQSIINSKMQIGHYDISGRWHWDRAWAVGYDGWWAGDNLIWWPGADGYEATKVAHEAFLNSPGHRYWVLNSDVKEYGGGHSYNYNSRAGQYTEGFGMTNRSVEIPALPSGAVTPYTGTIDTKFTFVANFYSKDGYSSTSAKVYIDGVPFDMQLSSGTSSNGTYRYPTKLPIGLDHNYYFYFEYGPGLSYRWPETGSYNYPDVREFMPDLLPYSTWPTSIPVGYESMLTASVFNEGEQPTNDVEVKVYLEDPREGGKQIGSIQVLDQLDPGQGQQVEVAWKPESLGTYQIYVWVDPDNQIEEINENNNLNSTTVEVRESGIDLKSSPPWTSNWAASREVRIYSWVSNMGEVEADNVEVRFYLGDPNYGGTQIGSKQIISKMDPGYGEMAEAIWIPDKNGIFDIFVWVDPDNSIVEVNELNNLSSSQIEIKDAHLIFIPLVRKNS